LFVEAAIKIQVKLQIAIPSGGLNLVNENVIKLTARKEIKPTKRTVIGR
jgi:hypothetical protein